MAVKKKSATAKKKTGARKRKTGVSGTATTVTVNGKRYTKKACGLTKADAQKRAKNHRAKGSTKFAVTRKNTAGTGFCVYTRG